MPTAYVEKKQRPTIYSGKRILTPADIPLTEIVVCSSKKSYSAEAPKWLYIPL
jgi:hypothetical protein